MLKTEEEKSKEKSEKVKVTAEIIEYQVLTEISDRAKLFYDQSKLGIVAHQHIQLSMLEALYLIDKDKLEIAGAKGKILSRNEFIKKAVKKEKNFLVKYAVFKDLRDRGYIVKTALKFGADFRVYDRGIAPGEDHAKWIVYPVHENSVMTWHEFSAKNRVAHSTKKKLLIGIVDDEGDCTYYEIKWTRP